MIASAHADFGFRGYGVLGLGLGFRGWVLGVGL